MRSLGALAPVADGELVSARVQVTGLRVERTWRRGVQRTTAYLRDGTGDAEATWFGRRFIEKRLHDGDWIIVSGKLRRRGWLVTIESPEFQHDAGQEILHAGRIVPVYRLTAGLLAPRLRRAVRTALDAAGRDYPEYLPPDVLAVERLPAIGRALEEAHFPTDFEARDTALRRLAFDELLALQVGMVGRRRARVREAGRRIRVPPDRDRSIRDALATALARKVGLDATLTADQASAMDDLRGDLGRATPMLRLIQGDVGSGKTAVAAYALAAVAEAGLQGAVLAPTDLLARQHAATLGALLEDLGIEVTLLTGSLSGKTRREALRVIAGGGAPVVVGTHALISEAVTFGSLALAVVDEQHRFGVEQRGALEMKANGLGPHVLLMTATPIPRTLGQVLYADLDVSNLRSLPAGRVPIRTAIRRPAELDKLWEFVREEAAAGHRTFVVVPLIEEVEEADEAAAAVAAEAEAERLRGLLAPLRVGLIHGRLRAAERDAEMARFRDGGLDVLVGTTVVEVGVDVPEATVMVVEAAERFGLAQLHQLRGRVGRGMARSWCALVSDVAEDTTGWARLKAIEGSNDGFELAEKDFELRREGDVLGYVQSGLPALRVASLQVPEHRDLAVRARRHAERLVDEAGDLRPGHEPLAHELSRGWLARVAAAEPSSPA
jgi:ATP-dependent DNA helicase RecG